MSPQAIAPVMAAMAAMMAAGRATRAGVVLRIALVSGDGEVQEVSKATHRRIACSSPDQGTGRANG